VYSDLNSSFEAWACRFNNYNLANSAVRIGRSSKDTSQSHPRAETGLAKGPYSSRDVTSFRVKWVPVLHSAFNGLVTVAVGHW